MRKMILGRIDILIGMGIIGILLLALAGTGSAHSAYGSVVGSNCGFCHSGIPTPLTANGIFFEENHKFDGLTEPITSAASCTNCHTNLTTAFLPLTSNGSFYNGTHRYNDTTLASARLAPPACSNCHANVSGGNFALISGVPATYLKSTTCENCHKRKFDNWSGTMHRVMLTDNSTAQEMGIPTPPNLTWTDMSYVIVGKQEMRYLNESGYLFKRFFAENGTSMDYGPGQYTCGRCHTTGYNASGGNQSGLPGIVGTWSEPGIACERCHGPAGNGHQVKADVSEQLCLECHNSSTRQGLFLSSAHSPPLKAPTSCLRCHSPFDYARNRTVTGDTAINVVCANCHNSHNTSDDKYRELFSPGGFNQTSYADVKDAKNSFFNSTASRLLLTGGPTGTLTAEKDVYDTLTTPALIPTDIIDDSYPGPIEVTGPVSEVLCSNCHYEHGLSHIAEVNLTHARLNYPGLGLQPATCTDCHMSGTQKNHSFNVKDEMNFPSKTCSRGTECHVTSDQNLNHSIFSLVPEVNEWRQSLHNEKANGGFYINSTGVPRERESSCSKCHSPSNWNPLNERAIVSASDFNGITCAVCHNIHDMGDWLKKTGKPYAWYNRDAIPVLNATGGLTRYKANYSIMANTTELCGNCHSNDNPRIFREGPGWNNTNDTTPIIPHGLPAKDIFAGSWKQINLGFECISCHMATKVTDPTNMTEMVLPDSQKVKGHSFKVNVSLLQSNTTCAGCHTTGTQPGNLSATIETIQADTQAKWNTTNTTVMDALGTINAFAGEKNLSRNMIADAYWKLQLVSLEGSWGVHNPVKVINMLNESSTEATDAVKALGSTGPGNQTGNLTFIANLSGSEEVPPVVTQALGKATFILENDTVHFTVVVSNITNTTASHIHLAPAGQNGPIVALLYPGPTKTDSFDGVLAQGNITAENLTGPLEGMPLSALIDNMTAGNTYANVHTVQNPGGEIRGQIKTEVSVTPTFSISGFKIDDNGTGLANWTIMLTKPDNTVMNNITDASGMYQFMNLSDGTYTVAEQMQPGWTNVSAMPMQVTINGADVMNQNITNRQLQPGEIPNISGANIISILPSTEIVNNQAGENRTFSITVDKVADISWQINGTEVSGATNVTSSSYVSSAAAGTWNVTAIASNINGTDMHKWDWIVRSPTAVNIAIQSFAFNPANITVLKGTSVIWTNNDVDAHTVTSDTGVFDSGTLNQGNTFEFMFNDTGTFKYHCTLHPTMHGEVIVIAAPAPTIPPMEEIGVGLELVADNFTSPIALVSPEDGTGRRFIVDQIGVIKIINTSGQIIEEPFLDLRSKIVELAPQYDERGLLGLAFHPNFSQNGRFFVYYSSPLRTQAPSNWNHTSIVSEFKVLQDNQNRANDSSERVLLQVDKPQANHNAGQIAFGPDGYLYIPLGDGGGANDFGIGHPPPGNGQNISTLLGKILRIDVDNGDPYGIPPDNPYVGKDGLDEIFALGFRNPFHISFDTGGNHSLFAGDSGQNAWEEVDIVTRGGNYGWNIKEGAHCFDPNNPNLINQSCPDVDANGQPLIDPVIEYANARQPGGVGVVVVGGYVYRGSELLQFNGNYIFGDFSKGPAAGNGSLFVARPPSSGEGMWSTKELLIATSSNGRINEFVRSFGQDSDHELYVLTSQMLGPTNNTGKIYKIKQFTIPNNFTANLSSSEIVQQPVVSLAKGNATFELSDNGTRLHYRIMVENIENVTMAHIHLAPAGVNGPVVAWLYPEVPPAVLIPGRFDGLLVEGNITSINLSGPLAGQPLNALLEAMMKGNTYVNVHTNQYPEGEIRGQITASRVLQELKAITVSPPTAMVSVGNNQVFNAKTLDQNGAPIAGVNITFTSGNTTVGTVSPETAVTGANGIATATFAAVGAGTAMVSATSGNITGSANVTVSSQPSQPNVTSFELTPDKTAALKGSTITITVRALNANVTDTNFNGMAGITVNASKNASAVIYPPNVTFNNGIATLPVTSNIAQLVTVTATSGSITGSTAIVFADMVFDLDMGWNLISIPNFADPSSVDMILKNVKNNGVVGYDPGNKTFSTPADLLPLYGYWINVTAPNQSIGFIADMTIRSIPPGRDLFEGWNLIGVVASKQEQNKQLDAGLLFQPLQAGGKPLYSYLVSYKNPLMTYTVGDGLTDRTPLNKGQGYWLFLNTLTETNKNSLGWAGKPWLPN